MSTKIGPSGSYNSQSTTSTAVPTVTTSSQTSHTTTAAGSTQEEADLQAAIELSRQALERPSPQKLFTKIIEDGLSGKWSDCSHRITSLVSTPHTDLEQVYLLAEQVDMQIQQGRFDEALASISFARSLYPQSIHSAYLSYLEAKTHYYQGNYTKALAAIAEAPLNTSGRVFCYLMEIKALSHLKLEEVDEAGIAIAQARENIKEERTAPRFSSPETLANLANRPVYLLLVREEKLTVQFRLEQTYKFYLLLSKNFTEFNRSYLVTAERAKKSKRGAEYENTLLSVYALLLQNQARDAVQLFSALPPYQGDRAHIKATYEYLNSYLSLHSAPAVFLTHIEQAISGNLLFPLTANEILFCRATKARLEGHHAEAIQLLIELRRALDPNSREAQYLYLLCFELAIKSRDLSLADELSSTPLRGEPELQMRILICNIELLFLQKRYEQAFRLMKSNENITAQFPHVRAYLLCKQARLLIDINPNLAEILAGEARTIFSKPPRIPPPSIPSPLRCDELFLSHFAQNTTPPFSAEIPSMTVEQEIDDIFALSFVAQGKQVPLQSRLLPHHLRGFLQIKTRQWEKAFQFFSAVTEADEFPVRASSFHQAAFLYLLHDNFSAAKDCLQLVIDSYAQYLGPIELEYCAMVNALLGKDLKSAHAKVKAMLSEFSHLPQEYLQILRLTDAHLQILLHMRGANKKIAAIVARSSSLPGELANIEQILQSKPEISEDAYSLLFTDTQQSDSQIITAYRNFLCAYYFQVKKDIQQAEKHYERALTTLPFLKKLILQQYAFFSFSCRNYTRATALAMESQQIDIKPDSFPNNRAVSSDNLFSDNAPYFLFVPLLLHGPYQNNASLLQHFDTMTSSCTKPIPPLQPEQFGPNRAFFYTLSLVRHAQIDDAGPFLDKHFPFLDPDAVLLDKELTAPEQRLVVVRAFAFSISGNRREEELLLSKLAAGKHIARDSIDYEEKVFCIILHALRIGGLSRALQNLEILLHNSFLPPERIAYLLAEKAYLLWRTQPKEECLELTVEIVLSSLEAKKHQPSPNTLAYLEYIRGKIIISRGHYETAQQCFAKALEKPIPSLPLKLLIYTEWLRCSIKLQDGAAISQWLEAIAQTRTDVECLQARLVAAPDLYLQNAGAEDRFFAIEGKQNLLASAGYEIAKAALLVQNNDIAFATVQSTLLFPSLSLGQRAELQLLLGLIYFNMKRLFQAQRTLREIDTTFLTKQIQRNVAYVTAFITYCEQNEQISSQGIEQLEGSLPSNHRYCFDLATAKLLNAIKSGNKDDVELQIRALLANSHTPRGLRAYLLGIQAYFAEHTQATPLLAEAFSSLKPDQLSKEEIKTLKKPLIDTHFQLEIGRIKLLSLITQGKKGAIEKHLQDLLSNRHISSDFKAYLLQVQAYLAQRSKTPFLLEQALSSLEGENILYLYLHIIDLQNIHKSTDLSRVSNIPSFDHELEKAPPLLRANYYLAKSKCLFISGQFLQAANAIKRGLAALEEKERPIQFSSEEEGFFFPYQRQRGTLFPCVTDRAILADSLHEMAILSYSRLEQGHAQIFEHAKQALTLPSTIVSGKRRQEYLVSFVRAGIELKRHNDVHVAVLELDKKTDPNDDKKSKIAEWIRTIEDAIASEYHIADPNS